jgi:hypothetical protein
MERLCLLCGKPFTYKRKDQVYCKRPECVRERQRSYSANARKKRNPESFGVGKGGSNLRGVEHPQYSNGKGILNHMRQLVKHEDRYCQHCGKDLKDAPPSMWCVHHKNRDRTHNTRDNLVLLCKRCHQLEHKCWRAFEGATTISQESRL